MRAILAISSFWYFMTTN